MTSQVCYCSAIAYPHRHKSGDCLAPHPIGKTERKPTCSECPTNPIKISDPFGTGDSPTEYECVLPYCPWETSHD